jgi:hypothetical protein
MVVHQHDLPILFHKTTTNIFLNRLCVVLIYSYIVDGTKVIE